MAITVPRPCSTEVLWGDLQKAVHDQKPTNLAQLEKYSLEGWTKISAKRLQRLIEVTIHSSVIVFYYLCISSLAYIVLPTADQIE